MPLFPSVPVWSMRLGTRFYLFTWALWKESSGEKSLKAMSTHWRTSTVHLTRPGKAWRTTAGNIMSWSIVLRKIKGTTGTMPHRCLSYSNLLDLPSSPADFWGLPGITGPGHHRLDGLAQQQPFKGEREKGSIVSTCDGWFSSCHLDTI